MTTPPLATPARRINCERCGASFTCDLGGHCWCMDEDVRLPLPATADGGDCLCRDCLRAAAAGDFSQRAESAQGLVHTFATERKMT